MEKVKGSKERQIQHAANKGFFLEPHLALTRSEIVSLAGSEETGRAERKGYHLYLRVSTMNDLTSMGRAGERCPLQDRVLCFGRVL